MEALYDFEARVGSHFIAQKDETCVRCGEDIPAGSRFGVNTYEDPVCMDCIDFYHNQNEYVPPIK